MSYEIIYKKYNVECGDYIMPLICTGSNNCYEVRWNGRERRERSWGINYFFGVDSKKLVYTKSELEIADTKMKHEMIDEVRSHMDGNKTDKEIEAMDSQSWLCVRTTSYSTVKQLFGAMNRTKKTIPLKDFIKQNGKFRIRLYHWATYPNIDVLFDTWIESEADILEANRKYIELGNPCVDIIGIRENMSFTCNDGRYVIMKGNSYFERKRNNRTYWTYYAARRFVSRNKAESYIRDNLSHMNGLTVKCLDELMTA